MVEGVKLGDWFMPCVGDGSIARDTLGSSGVRPMIGVSGGRSINESKSASVELVSGISPRLSGEDDGVDGSVAVRREI